MINNIVDVSKIESGQMQITITETNIHDLLKYLYSFFEPEAAAKGLTLIQTTRLTAGEMIIRTDKEKLYAILTNLVKNSIKFTSQGRIVFGVERNGQELEFYVRDTGFGIQADRLDSIFNRFEQGHESNKMVPEGSGLGLSISKAYAEMLGGKIRVKSQVGVGSEFIFTIPYNHAD
jgi:signal transduction histidine kinase